LSDLNFHLAISISSACRLRRPQPCRQDCKHDKFSNLFIHSRPPHLRNRRGAAVGERIRPALTIVRNEAPDGHGLHRMVGDANRAVVNAGRDAEQNYVVLRAEFGRRIFHHLLPPASPGQRRGKSLLVPFGSAFGSRLGDPRARRGNRGSGLTRARKQSQAVIVGGISLEAAPTARPRRVRSS
jgi:hypothetical protein